MGILDKLLHRKGGGPTAAKQQGDVHALDTPGDPRGGVQSEDYRLAGPEDVVTEGDVTMAGPGGSPAEDASAEERRERDRGDEAEYHHEHEHGHEH